MSNIIGFPPKQEEPKGPPMGFYRVKTLNNQEGSVHYGYLIMTSSFMGITDEDSNLTYACPMDSLIDVTRESLDLLDPSVN